MEREGSEEKRRKEERPKDISEVSAVPDSPTLVPSTIQMPDFPQREIG